MKIGMLVGACGLALAGTSFAGGKADLGPQYEKISEYTSFTKGARKAQMYTEGASFGGASSVSLLRGVDPSIPGAVFGDTFDNEDADGPPQDQPGFYNRAMGLIDPADYTGSFSLGAGGGQLNFDGQPWGVATEWGGIVDNAVAISNTDGDPSNGEYNGPAGGPDPMGVRGGMLHVQRASVQDDPIDAGFGLFQYVSGTDLYLGTNSEPCLLTMDFYKPSSEEFIWWDPTSFTEGLVTARLFFGGFFDSGTLGTLAGKFGDPQLIEQTIILGLLPGSFTQGQFVISPHEIPSGDWFTSAILVSPSAYAIFVQDNSTLADNMGGGDGPDYKMPVRDSGPFSGDRMFSEFDFDGMGGIDLSEGWVQIYPGIEDDPATMDVIEGDGLAFNINDEPVQAVNDVNGNQVSVPLAAISFDSPFDFAFGSDPNAMQRPGYVIKDYWLDNVRLYGMEFVQPDPIPDWSFPYIDDAELWFTGALGIQGDRWSELPSAFTEVVDNRNTTMGGEKAFEQTNVIADGQYRNEFQTDIPTTPRAQARPGDPLEISMNVRLEGVGNPETVRVVSVRDNDVFLEADGSDNLSPRVLFGAIDNANESDGKLYVRQIRPKGTGAGEFDESEPNQAALLDGPHIQPSLSQPLNMPFDNVLAAPAGSADFDVPVGTFLSLQILVEPNTAREPQFGEQVGVARIFIDGVEMFPNGDDTQQWLVPSLTTDQLDFGSGNNALGLLEAFNIDDINVDGPLNVRPEVTVVNDPMSVYADDPAWELPFFDGLNTYEKGVGDAAAGQGFALRFGAFQPVQDPAANLQDFDELELLNDADPLTDGDDVVVYEIASVDSGTFMVGDQVAVGLDGFPKETDDTFPRFGNTAEATDFEILDAPGGSVIASGTWTLVGPTEDTPDSPTDPLAFDSGTMVDSGSRYNFVYLSRWGGSDNESQFIDADDAGVNSDVGGARGGFDRGDVSQLTNTGNTGIPQNAFFMFNGQLPPAVTVNPDDTAELSFEIYVDSTATESGFFVTFDGAGSAETSGDITNLSFGGRGFQSGNPDGMTGITPELDTGNFGLLVPNPAPGEGNPENIYQDTGVAVPLNQWIEVNFTVDGQSNYTISVDDGSGPQMLTTTDSGVAIDKDEANLNTSDIDFVGFARNNDGDGSGELVAGEVRWEARGPNENPGIFGGLSIWHQYEISDIDTTADEPVNPGVPNPDIAGMVQPVNPETGDPAEDFFGNPLDPRALQNSDVVAVRNINPDTGTAFSEQLLNTRWRLVATGARGGGMGETVRAAGDWIVLGLPGEGNLNNPELPGGIANSSPAYNGEAPFRNIVLGDYVAVEDGFVGETEQWYVDNISLSLTTVQPCPADLSGDDQVNATDLGILIAAWGSPTGNPNADLTDDGNVNATDLGVLIAAWGDCP